MKTKIGLQISRLLNERFKLNADGLEEKLSAVRDAFEKKEKKILDGLRKITGLSFLRNYIDVFLINPDNAPSISFPVIVKFYGDTNETICIIVHELIHNLMWDNNKNVNWSLKIQELFKDENRKTAIHIAVHAVLEAVYMDVLNEPEEIVKNIKQSQDKPDYRRAWEIVKAEGYKNIIAKLKSQK